MNKILKSWSLMLFISYGVGFFFDILMALAGVELWLRIVFCSITGGWLGWNWNDMYNLHMEGTSYDKSFKG